jgi:hypothetical protein
MIRMMAEFYALQYLEQQIRAKSTLARVAVRQKRAKTKYRGLSLRSG